MKAFELLKTKTYLTNEEREILLALDNQFAVEYLFNVRNDQWLNLSVYSEADKEERDLRIEQGL